MKQSPSMTPESCIEQAFYKGTDSLNFDDLMKFFPEGPTAVADMLILKDVKVTLRAKATEAESQEDNHRFDIYIVLESDNPAFCLALPTKSAINGFIHFKSQKDASDIVSPLKLG